MGDGDSRTTGGVPSIIPVSDEQAKAIGSLSGFGVTVVTEAGVGSHGMWDASAEPSLTTPWVFC
jgi:hypothetical protein